MTEPLGYVPVQIIPVLDGITGDMDKKLAGPLKAVGLKGAKEFAKGVGDGLKDLEREVESASKAYQKLSDKAEDELGKVRKAEASLQELRDKGVTSGARWVAAEERLATAKRNSSRANRDAEDGHRKLADAQKRLGDGSNDLGGKLGRLSGIAGAAGTALAGAGAVAGGAALAGVAALGAGVVVAGKELYELGAAFDDLSDNMQVKTGLTGSALEELKESVTDLGTTNVPSTFAEIGDVAADVTRNLHLTGQPLEDITSRLANLDRLGQSVDVRNLGKAFRGFGVDVEDQVPSLNALYEASTQSGLGIDEIVASVVKGGPALRQLGLTFGESAALAGQLEDAGLDVDKMLSAGLTKSLAALAKDGQTGQDALVGVIDEVQRLIDVGDVAGAQELTNKLFGSKGGLQFFEAIQSGALDLRSLSDSLNQTGLDINDVSEDTADWSERWQTLKNEVSVALEPLAGRLFDGVNEQLGNAADLVSENKDVIVDAFVGIADTTVTFAEVGIRSIGLFADGLGQLVAPIGDVLGAGADFQAWTEEMAGNDERAAELREEAQGYYSMGEGLTAFGRSIKDTDLDGLRDMIQGIGNEAKGTDEVFYTFGASGFNWDEVAKHESSGRWDDNNSGGHTTSSGAPRGGLQITDGTWSAYGGTEFAPTAAGATKGEQIAVAERIAFSGYNGAAPQGLGAWEVITQGKVAGVTANTQPPVIPSGSSSGGNFSDAGLNPAAAALNDIVGQVFPQIETIGGYRQDPHPDHPSGRALDIMIPGGTVRGGANPEGEALGDQIWDFLMSTGVVDPRGSLWKTDTGGDHFDHIHARIKEGMENAVPSAFSAGYDPVGGTPGVNEYGEPGYFEVDPKAVREAQQRIDDQMERIRESDENARQAGLALTQLEEDADQAEIDAAVERKRKADYEAGVARRELEDLKGELGEAQQGKFSPADAVSSRGTGAGRGGRADGFNMPSSFSDIGSAIGEFAGGQLGSALEVFGISDSPPWLKGITTFLGGLSISDSAGNSVFDGSNLFGGGSAAPSAPLPASAEPGGATPHGTQGGAAPGPTYNIRTATVEDAFLAAQRKERERALSRVARF